ncbi:PKD domain-containing protein [Halorussus salinisoli]|uniref:PKD domain-containing protein n=1 Tax=Halorussus salinisoli TaxID=2558242 RepID=UPI0010C23CA5|nr:PKD domain-containing protein [Halorussus salinisoli]
MAREQTPLSVSDIGGARPTIAVLAAVLLVASVLVPVSTTAAVGPGDRASVVAAAGTAGETSVANDEPTTVADDGTATTDDGTTTTAANDESVTIRGRVEDADGDPVGDGTVRLGSADRNRTDERGRYVLRGEENRSYDLTYRQTNASESAGDGRPAVYAVGRVNASTDQTRNVSLPAASRLNVTVVAQNETAVENATVRLTHARGGANATLAGETDEQGRLTVDGRTGVELAGNVTVAVEAPNASLSDCEVSLSMASATDERVVLPLNDTDRPTLDYEVSTRTANVSELVQFDASDSTDASGIAATTWEFPNATEDRASIGYRFTGRGDYEVTLTVEDYAGNVNRTTVDVSVVDQRDPEAVLDANATNVTVNERVEFDATGASDDETGIAEYRWDFDDGTTEETTDDSTVVHEYAENGTYDATVVVVDEAGNRANATRRVVAMESRPTANFTVSNPSPAIGETVAFEATSTDAVGNDTEYEWEIRYPTHSVVLGGRDIEREFPDSGPYGVTLTVTDEQGRTDRETRTVEVANEPPEANAGSNQSVVAGTEVTLDGRYTTDLHDNFTFEWNRTAGPKVNLSDESAVTPGFTAPDVNRTRTLQFDLTATDDHGANDTDSVAVTVVPSASPNVSHAPETPTVGEPVTFRANRTGEYRWDFDGDGIADAVPDDENVTDASATHEFDDAGEYDVTLVDAAGREVVENVTVAPTNDSESGGGAGSSGGAGGSTGVSAASGGAAGGGGGATGAAGGQTGGAIATGESASDDADDDRTTTANRPESPTVTVERVGDEGDRVVAAVENATADDPAQVLLPDEFGGNRSAFEAVSVVSAGVSNFSLAMSASADRLEGTPEPKAGAVLSYLEVTERNLTDAEIGSARFGFRVAVETLDAAGVSPDAVRLYRYHDGEWQTLAANLVETKGGFYRFEAVSPGFSVFAVGVEPGAIESEDVMAQADDGTQSGASDDADDDGTAGRDGESAGERRASDSGEIGGLSGVSDDVLLLGLFAAALFAAALWGYLLS